MFVTWEYITIWYTVPPFCKTGQYVSNERYSNHCKNYTKNYDKILRLELVCHHRWKLKQLLIYVAFFMFDTAGEACKFTAYQWVNHIITTPEVWRAHCILILTRISYLSA